MEEKKLYYIQEELQSFASFKIIDNKKGENNLYTRF